jgi:hypothetical protein
MFSSFWIHLARLSLSFKIPIFEKTACCLISGERKSPKTFDITGFTKYFFISIWEGLGLQGACLTQSDRLLPTASRRFCKRAPRVIISQLGVGGGEG